MKLLPGWHNKIDQNTPVSPREIRLPLSTKKLAQSTQRISNEEDAQRMVQYVYEKPVSYIGMDTEYRYEADGPITVSKTKGWWDIKSVHAFCLAFALVNDEAIVRFALDLRQNELHPFVQRVLDLPVPFVCHSASSELYVLWKLGLREPGILWDTFLAERALRLGKKRSGKSKPELSQPEEIQKKEQAEECYERSLSLDAVAHHYRIPCNRAGVKGHLQSAFLTKPVDEPLSDDEIEYCAEDAQLTALIREPQRVMCDRAGICETLDRVIMPWNVTAAEISWTGVELDRGKCQSFLQASQAMQRQLRSRMKHFQICNPGSPQQIGSFLERYNLARFFPRTDTDQVCTKDKILEEREHLHPAIALVRQYRKIRMLSKDPAVLGLIEGKDGRVHAKFTVLGAESGRTQSSVPNLMGIGKSFRPFVRATDGYAIGDVDLSQIEIGIAAAVFRDERMIEDFNSGDVYVGQMKRMLPHEIPPEDWDLPDAELKKKHKRLRDRCKPLALGIIYGKTIPGIALELKISRREARRLWESFCNHYPNLCRGMDDAREQSIRRGYAYITGLRRFYPGRKEPSPGDKRSLGNSYVQGTAALVFFDAGNRLRRLYHRLGARLIIPVHDAFVFESPRKYFEEVAELTRRVMTETVQEWFPELHPRAAVNVEHPDCWNYEGNADSVERFITDPTLRL
mgnify:CR=1 FL=1